MNKYFIYWTEDRRDNIKKPSIWNCIITSNATKDDIPIFEKYNEFISSFTNNKINVGWLENESNISVDEFVKDQNFYNDYIEGDIENEFYKNEQDNVSLQNLKVELDSLVDYYYGLSGEKQDMFTEGFLNVLNEHFINKNKPFIKLKDIKFLIKNIEETFEEKDDKKNKKNKQKLNNAN